MAEPALDPATMNRLAFIRLLYQQAVALSGQPEPLSAASILTFHDTVELFLILAAEHRSAPALSRDGAFLEYWRVLRPHRGYDKGVELPGHLAMSRLHSVRNSFKHAGKLPTRADVEDAHSSVGNFLEDGTFMVFGVRFAEIDLADVVPQRHAKERLKAAAAAESAGRRVDAMAHLAVAFGDVTAAGTGPGRDDLLFYFGPSVGVEVEGRTEKLSDYTYEVEELDEPVEVLKESPSMKLEQLFRDQEVDERLRQLSEAVTHMQKAMRIIAFGIDYGQFLRFERLTPNVIYSGTRQSWFTERELFAAPTREEYDFCVHFVISAALRVAEVETHSVQPTWWPR